MDDRWNTAGDELANDAAPRKFNHRELFLELEVLRLSIEQSRSHLLCSELQAARRSLQDAHDQTLDIDHADVAACLGLGTSIGLGNAVVRLQSCVLHALNLLDEGKIVQASDALYEGLQH